MPVSSPDASYDRRKNAQVILGFCVPYPNTGFGHDQGLFAARVPACGSDQEVFENGVWFGLVGSGLVGSGRVGSGRVGSGRVGSGRVGSGRVGSGRIGSAWVGSGRIGLGRVRPGREVLKHNTSGRVTLTRFDRLKKEARMTPKARDPMDPFDACLTTVGVDRRMQLG